MIELLARIPFGVVAMIGTVKSIPQNIRWTFIILGGILLINQIIFGIIYIKQSNDAIKRHYKILSNMINY